MAGLLKSAAEAIDRGAITERRALGMDMARGTVAEADATAVDTGRAMDIVRKLDLSLGLQLRKVVAAHLEARRDSPGTCCTSWSGSPTPALASAPLGFGWKLIEKVPDDDASLN